MSNPASNEVKRGPCAKRQTECVIVAMDGRRFIGRNDCANPQEVCPRGPFCGYEKCRTICQQSGHAEAEALKLAGSAARGGHATLTGHYYVCEPCGAALRDAGVASLMVLYP